MAAAQNPIDGFSVTEKDVSFVGHDLQRPECILAERDGSLFSADMRGIMHVKPDGTQHLIQQHGPGAFDASTIPEAERLTRGTLPNGLAFARNGDIVIANFGTDRLELIFGQSRDGDLNRKEEVGMSL